MGCYFLLQGILPNPGIEPVSPALQAGSLPLSRQGSPHLITEAPESRGHLLARWWQHTCQRDSNGEEDSMCCCCFEFGGGHQRRSANAECGPQVRASREEKISVLRLQVNESVNNLNGLEAAHSPSGPSHTSGLANTLIWGLENSEHETQPTL